MRKQFFKTSSLAVAMAVLSSVAAMGQQRDSQSIDWMKELTNRIELHGYAQGGYSYDDINGKTNSSFNLKRTLFWAKARVTDRFSFLFMHDFSSVVQEYYLDYRFSNDKSLNFRLGQFKHSYSMENPLSPTRCLNSSTSIPKPSSTLQAKAPTPSTVSITVVTLA